MRREPRRKTGNESTRYELGAEKDLLRIREKADSQPVRLSVTVVQPGLSTADASKSQLELLAVTENYIIETFAVPFQGRWKCVASRLYVSETVIAEYREVLARPELRIRKGLRQQLLQLIRSHSQTVTRRGRSRSHPILTTTSSWNAPTPAHADYLGTGNPRHFSEILEDN